MGLSENREIWQSNETTIEKTKKYFEYTRSTYLMKAYKRYNFLIEIPKMKYHLAG